MIVSGLANSDLASPSQGICGVEIHFDHEYLGDLTVTLISPDGTSVGLIGPTTTAITPTNLSTWDINFVPCATPAAPDAGFTAMWSNIQAWQALTPYSGTYHPNAGCLEDFDSGSANGLWQVVIEDHEALQLGNLIEVTLIFCDPTGLNCLLCEPNAGMLSPLSLNICSGENFQSSDIMVDFGGPQPSPLVYSYEYILTSGNTILQTGNNFSITPPVGSFQICGLSYLTDDSVTINALIATDDFDLLSQAVADGVVCADLTSSCIALEVTGKPDTIFVSTDLCGGEVFTYGGQDYVSDGVFYQTHDGPGLCDTVHEIRISPRVLNVQVPIPDTLFCGMGDVSLSAIPSGGPGPFSYQWTTINGNITSMTTGSSITVNQSGQYFVEVSDGVCDGLGSGNVIPGPGFPQVVVTGGTITCSNPVVNLQPIFSPANATVAWTGPMGFSSNQPNIGVNVPGNYTLVITNAAGCITSRSVTVALDTMTRTPAIQIVDMNCQTMIASLGTNFSKFEVEYEWNGPNGYFSNSWRPGITDPGVYTLTATFPNGCIRTGTFVFNGDFTIPDMQMPPDDTLNCNEIITLTVTSGTPGTVFAWTGPDNFSSMQASIMIEQEGVYSAVVTAPNGCKNFGDVDIFQGDDIFSFTKIRDTLTCSEPIGTIGVITSDADIFEWLNYTGPGDDQPMIQVDDGGNYTLQMTDSNSGCVVVINIRVIEDFVVPPFNYTVDTVTCFEPIAEFNFVPTAGVNYASVFWELPDLSIVNDVTLMSSVPGIYTLTAIGANGCQSSRSIDLPFDTLRPFLILEADTLICRDTAMLVAQSLDSVSTLQWSGPGIIETNDFVAFVNEAGWYHLSAAGPNGCPAELDILVDSNFVLPTYTLTHDTLECGEDALMVIDPVLTGNQFRWFDPGNSLISTDTFVSVNQPGVYAIEIEGLNQCIAFDTVRLDSLDYPDLAIITDTFTCVRNMADIEALTDLAQNTIAWTDLNTDTLSLLPIFTVPDAGPYVLSVTGPNNCTSLDTIRVPYDTLAPSVVIQQVGDIRCQEREVVLDGSASFPSPLSYTWSATNGMILSDPTASMVDILDTGLYVLSVVYLQNGCTDSDSLMVVQHPDAITSADLIVLSPRCHGEGNASIEVAALSGGVGMINYQLNNGPLQASPYFEDLSAGIYTLTAIDQANCVFDTLVQIDTSIIFSVDAGPDIEIYIGETTTLEGMTDLSDDNVSGNAWLEYGSIICTDCVTEEVSPLETTTYSYQVMSNSGCVLSDEMIVYVLDQARFYIANVFSPNGDGINDIINLNSTGGIETVLQWIIFDRWGDAVFGATNFDPMDASVFWDGRTSTGEFSNPGVFPYVIEFQLISGKRRVHHGEITLLR